jgi:phospholipid/cholesterol/gamma-HCH transport system permease protein
MDGAYLGDTRLVSPVEFAKSKVASVQEYSFMAGRSLANLFRRPIYLADMVVQADVIGFGSLPIVLAACFFTGAALAMSSASTLTRFGANTLVGELVAIGIVRELGPVIAGLVVAGRNAAGMASELGSMIVTEQIDAMRALGADPMKKLVTPRVVSTVFMLFFLTILGDLLGLMGGGVVSSLLLRSDLHQYWSTSWRSLDHQDVFIGLTKPVVFGFIIATIGCYYGMSTKGGTEGVGRATTQAVVASMILIIALDVFLTRLMMVVLESS